MNVRRPFYAIALLLVLGTAMARAEIDAPLVHLEKVATDFAKTVVSKVKTARVLVADYELLKRDFPELRRYGSNETAKIDEWLLTHAGYIATLVDLCGIEPLSSLLPWGSPMSVVLHVIKKIHIISNGYAPFDLTVKTTPGLTKFRQSN
ncbi:hypothetical protein WDW37_20845 [Bdellovibrionota bacterium FG-1]